MSDIVRMTLIDGEIRGGAYDLGGGRYGDGLLSTGLIHPVTEDRLLERRKEIVELYRVGLAASETVVLTLGLVECWYDLHDRVYLNDYPGYANAKAEPNRFEFRRLGAADCLSMLSAMIEILSADKKRNVVLTVSPVPHGATFASEDALVSNMYSKSVLRVVADELMRSFENVDYFPSYEIVVSGGLASYESDQIHVRSSVVGKIVRYMLNEYATNDAVVTNTPRELDDLERNFLS